MHDDERLLFAVPKKGRLYERVLELLKECGLDYTRQPRLGLAQVNSLPIDIVFLPAHDIAEYVAVGKCDIGITGQDIIAEAGHDDDVTTILNFGFGNCRLCIEAPAGQFTSGKELAGKRIVTSFPYLTKKYFDKLDDASNPTVIKYVTGSVEVACSLGIADAVVDLVETGTTMKAAGLEIVETIMETETILVTKKEVPEKYKNLIETLKCRFEGYLTAKKHVMISYNIPSSSLEAACKITPGMESPTILHLADENWKAVSALIGRKEVSVIMDKLVAVGAKSVLVMGLQNSRFR